MPRRISERYSAAFVTGAASGLGAAFAEMLVAEGVRVWGTSRDPARLERQTGIVPVALDLSDADAAAAAFDRASREAGDGFDIVINNAGYGVFGEFAAADYALWQAQMEAMLVATLRIAHAAWKSMGARNRGALVNVSSIAVDFPLPYMSGYNVCKAGLSALSESLLFESRGTAVRVIDFRPGDYRTAFNDNVRTAGGSSANPPRLAAAWRALEANFRSAPPAARAAVDLRDALLRNRCGVVRSGTFFQARLAPFVARLAPAPAIRALAARYFKSP
jgi:short-subunit dehydrogenase